MTLYATNVAPICEDCNIQMVERKRKHDGKPFFGCSNFPRCSNSKSIDEGGGFVSDCCGESCYKESDSNDEFDTYFVCDECGQKCRPKRSNE